MRKLLLAATALAALSFTPAKATTITLGGQLWTIGGTELTLGQVPPPGNQPLNTPCIICGTNQPGQPANFGYNNYKQNGHETSFIEFSSATVGAKLNQDQIGTGYDVSFLKAFLLAQGDLDFALKLGIDVNTATGAGPEVLEAFAILDLTTHTVLASYSLLDTIGTPLPTNNNGNGFPDYTLSGFNLAGTGIANDQIVFYSRWSNTSDGAESFFLVPVPSVAAVPEPSTWAMLLLGFAGISIYGGMRARRNKSEASFRLA